MKMTKKLAAAILTLCLIVGILTACGGHGADTAAQPQTEPQTEPQTTEPQTSEAQTTIDFSQMTDEELLSEDMCEKPEQEETTQPVQTEPAQPEKLPARLEPFYEKLRSDRWIEITEDMPHAMCMEFTADGGLHVYAYMKTGGVVQSEDDTWETTYRPEERTWRDSRIIYSNMYSALYAFEDMDYDDCIHLIEDAAITYHRVMIRESKYDQARKFADSLKNTRWTSDWFKKNGIDSVSIDDFDVIPINETTAHLVYHNVVNDHTAQVTVMQTADSRKLDAYLIRTYAVSGYCPETEWFPETWTRA